MAWVWDKSRMCRNAACKYSCPTSETPVLNVFIIHRVQCVSVIISTINRTLTRLTG
jgi:hypothetical protein